MPVGLPTGSTEPQWEQERGSQSDLSIKPVESGCVKIAPDFLPAGILFSLTGQSHPLFLIGEKNDRVRMTYHALKACMTGRKSASKVDWVCV